MNTNQRLVSVKCHQQNYIRDHFLSVNTSDFYLHQIGFGLLSNGLNKYSILRPIYITKKDLTINGVTSAVTLVLEKLNSFQHRLK